MIYLDHAACTPMYPEVREVLKNLLDQDLGNPSSIHSRGREAKALIDEVRYLCARIFRANLDGVVFTSGATEAAHLAIIGSYLGLKYQISDIKYQKILVSPLVHKCVWSAISFLGKHFGVQYDCLPLTKDGFIDLEKFEAIDLSQYAQIICEHGNSEFGHVQPVAKMGRMIEKNSKTQESKNQKAPPDKGDGERSEPGGLKPVFIVDTAASIVSETISLEHLKCDILFFSGEKFGGPSGVGAIIKKEGITLTPIVGGSHEFGNRGGTENVMGIVGMGEALKQREIRREVLRAIWKDWHEQVRAQIANIKYQITTPKKDCLPHVIHFIHPNMKADLFVQKADLAGIALSAGSACSSGTVMGSQALQNLGYTEEQSKRGVRISWGWDSEESDLIGETICQFLRH
ncbi:MAG TPA: aminotransferase class V-fold PLP-dependent enzyme [Candidatus Gracilibacteria bacterium]